MRILNDKFYSVNAKKFKRYKFNSNAKIVNGDVPDFFALLKKYANKKFKVLDLGCGSGELTLKLFPFFKEIIGIDPVKEYIETAQKDKISFNIGNVSFIVADGRDLPFKDEIFDIVYSSRGPLSADLEFMREGARVLKKGGFLIEETIGENDKIEIKKIFNRGQNYPVEIKKLASVSSLLDKIGVKLLFSKYFLYYQAYSSIEEVVNTLERAPIIPNFNKARDAASIKKAEKKLITPDGIMLSSHRLHWVAGK